MKTRSVALFVALLVAVSAVILYATLTHRDTVSATKEGPRLDDGWRQIESAYVIAMVDEDCTQLENTLNRLSTHSHDLLEDIDMWTELHSRYYAMTVSRSDDAVSHGNIGYHKFKHTYDDVSMDIEYYYRLPSTYDYRKAWPLALCLSDRNIQTDSVDAGKAYIDKVWGRNPELSDTFILVAPSMRAVSSKGGQLSWSERSHAHKLLQPVTDVRRRFHVDSKKIFVEGVGHGADLAMEIGALYGGEMISGVVARHGLLQNPNLATGLMNINSIIFIRKNGPMDTDAFGSQISELRLLTRKKMSNESMVTVRSVDPIRRNHDQMNSRGADPLLEANKAISDFYQAHSMPNYPSKFYLTSNNWMFTRRAFVRAHRPRTGQQQFVDYRIQLDQHRNAVIIRGDNGAHTFAILLNDKILDLNRPISVYVNDELVKTQRVKRSLRQMTSSMRKRPYESRIFTASMIVECN